jgi:phage tail sheath protein FI
MTVTTSYPGVYIEELPSLVHSITPAPTSIAVFVGYTHPFLTKQTLTAVQLFSFADYQSNFGGFFSSPFLPDYVGQAVYQFFLNGGPTCYVVGLPVQGQAYYDAGAVQTETVEPATATIAQGSVSLDFTALQPTGVAATPPVGFGMTVGLSNITSDSKYADITITYSPLATGTPGGTVETYRRVGLTTTDTTTIYKADGSTDYVTLTALLPSKLATVAVTGVGASTTWSTAPSTAPSFDYPTGSVPSAGWEIMNLPDFGQVFAEGASLDKVSVFNLLVTPGVSDNSVASQCVAYAELKRAFYIMDTPSSSTTTGSGASEVKWDANDFVQNAAADIAAYAVPISINAGLYYPWLQTTDPVTGAPSLSPPSGYVAGMFGQEDNNEGVWKSPAGIETTLLGTTGVDPNGLMTDPQQGVLNNNAVNCIRQFPGVGTVIFGARTTAGADLAQQQWKYVAVRRTALFIEQSLYANLGWAVFQGNSQPLWDALVQETTAFMLSLFRQGAFAGTTPSQAFLVQCDSTTTTPTDVANGVVNLLVGFAPLVPAEFVVVQIAQLAGQAQS